MTNRVRVLQNQPQQALKLVHVARVHAHPRHHHSLRSQSEPFIDDSAVSEWASLLVIVSFPR